MDTASPISPTTPAPSSPDAPQASSSSPGPAAGSGLDRVRVLLLSLALLLGVACVFRVLAIATRPASAEMVTTIDGEMVALTADGGSEDVLVVLDNRAERIMVYKQMQTGLQLFASENLRDLFNRARLSAPQ